MFRKTQFLQFQKATEGKQNTQHIVHLIKPSKKTKTN